MTCETCRFWEENRCRRYPPKRGFWMIVYGFGFGDFEFPKTTADDWCGEHKRK